MVRMTFWIVIICVFLLFPLNVFSSSIKEDSELPERCGKMCDDWFKKRFGSGYGKLKNGSMSAHYKNHYNKKLNKCFILVSMTFTKDNNEGSFTDKSLYELNENVFYGNIMKAESDGHCNFFGKICKSESEWDLLVKPYMEE